MFSISKILALAAILGAVWYGFRLIGRLDEARQRKAGRHDRDSAGRGSAGPAAPPQAEDGILDLVKDERGNYVAKAPRDDRV